MPEQFLNAGDLHFFSTPEPANGVTPQPLLLRTLLGSCVAIILTHRSRRMGGMCHAVLPAVSGRYGPHDATHCEGAMHRFLQEIRRSAAAPNDFRAILVGGARMSMGMRQPTQISVGDRNIEAARRLLAAAGIPLVAEHVGKTGARRVDFHVHEGRVEVLHQNVRTTLKAT